MTTYKKLASKIVTFTFASTLLIASGEASGETANAIVDLLDLFLELVGLDDLPIDNLADYIEEFIDTIFNKSSYCDTGFESYEIEIPRQIGADCRVMLDNGTFEYGTITR